MRTPRHRVRIREGKAENGTRTGFCGRLVREVRGKRRLTTQSFLSVAIGSILAARRMSLRRAVSEPKVRQLGGRVTARAFSEMRRWAPRHELPPVYRPSRSCPMAAVLVHRMIRALQRDHQGPPPCPCARVVDGHLVFQRIRPGPGEALDDMQLLPGPAHEAAGFVIGAVSTTRVSPSQCPRESPSHC